MTPEQRLLTALELSESMRMVSAAGIQARHPEYNEQALFDALARLMLGDELFVEAFPNRPLLAP